VNEKKLTTLREIRDACTGDKMAWTQNGTRGAREADELSREGLIQSAGKSATGTYWTLTVNGLAELSLAATPESRDE